MIRLLVFENDNAGPAIMVRTAPQATRMLADRGPQCERIAYTTDE
jgi:hypothetical protein